MKSIIIRPRRFVSPTAERDEKRRIEKHKQLAEEMRRKIIVKGGK